MVEFSHEAEVRALAPRFDRLRAFDFGVIATARGTGRYDFISRYFAAPYGIDEDPVTGSAHCSLAPYWAERLGKTVVPRVAGLRPRRRVRVRLPATACACRATR